MDRLRKCAKETKVSPGQLSYAGASGERTLCWSERQKGILLWRRRGVQGEGAFPRFKGQVLSTQSAPVLYSSVTPTIHWSGLRCANACLTAGGAAATTTPNASLSSVHLFCLWLTVTPTCPPRITPSPARGHASCAVRDDDWRQSRSGTLSGAPKTAFGATTRAWESTWRRSPAMKWNRDVLCPAGLGEGKNKDFCLMPRPERTRAKG